MKRIGLLGCGAIGTQIAIAIDTGMIPAQLTHIFDSDVSKAETLVTKLKQKPEIVGNAHLLIIKSFGLGGRGCITRCSK